MTDEPASIELQRRIEWIDTDAAGIFHYTTVFRMAEAAEAALHDALGIMDLTFGRTPRVKVEVAFKKALRFWDLVDVHLAVVDVGRASVRQAFTISRDGQSVVEGEITMVLVDSDGGGATPWPDDVRDLLLHAGPQKPPSGL